MTGNIWYPTTRQIIRRQDEIHNGIAVDRWLVGWLEAAALVGLALLASYAVAG